MDLKFAMLDTICTSMPCDKAQSWWKWFCLVSTSRSIFHGSAMYWGAEGALSSPLAAMNLVCKANSLFPSSQGAPTLQQPPSNLHLLHLPPVPSHGVYTSSTPSQNFIHRPTFLSVETTPMMLHLKIWLVRFCIICMFRICTSVYRLHINGAAFYELRKCGCVYQELRNEYVSNNFPIFLVILHNDLGR